MKQPSPTIIDGIECIWLNTDVGPAAKVYAAVLWGKYKDDSLKALLYVKKPPHMSHEEYKYLLDRMEIILYDDPINLTTKTR